MRAGYLGVRTLVAFCGVLVLGLGIAAVGAAVFGVGVLLAIVGGGLAVGLLIRWAIYRQIG
jgi:hypothetical protein